MSLQRDVLPDLIDDIRSYHNQFAIVLIGSVAAGNEHPESDIDLNIFLSDDPVTDHTSPYIDTDNKWQLKIVCKWQEVRIDVAWETYLGLNERLQGDGPIHCWPFSNGEIIQDPCGLVAESIAVARTWFDDHPKDTERIVARHVKAKREQIRRRERHR